MSDTARLFASVGSHEGYRATPYADSEGLWTIGKGRCLETHPFTAAEWRQLLTMNALAVSLSVSGANWLLSQQLASVERDLARVYPFWPRLNDARQNALIELAYQIGEQAEESFHVMLAAIGRENWKAASDASLDSKWAKQTPERARVLARMIFTGEFPS